MARLGGDENSVHPRGYQQLEAVAYQRGEDGKLHTATISNWVRWR